MTDEERARFEAADRMVHPVGTQWHYPIMTRHGWSPLTAEAIGFVRSYDYVQRLHGIEHRIRVTTGVHADYWTDLTQEERSRQRPRPWTDGAGGYWRDLEPYLIGLAVKMT
jgi:hypothetical protein